MKSATKQAQCNSFLMVTFNISLWSRWFEKKKKLEEIKDKKSKLLHECNSPAVAPDPNPKTSYTPGEKAVGS